MARADVRKLSQMALTDARAASAWLRRGRPATSPLLPQQVRLLLLRLAGLDIAPTVTGLTRCIFMSPAVTIGPRSWVAQGCLFEGGGAVEIGANCSIGPESVFITSRHEILPDGGIREEPEYYPIKIGAGSWLGARVTVLAGVTIGEKTVVGAGAVVVKDCGPGGVWAGVPARRVR
jgi:acetyltransferase-like isoleucine patch superfamily enzyme